MNSFQYYQNAKKELEELMETFFDLSPEEKITAGTKFKELAEDIAELEEEF